jgi:hypothetical protein
MLVNGIISDICVNTIAKWLEENRRSTWEGDQQQPEGSEQAGAAVTLYTHIRNSLSINLARNTRHPNWAFLLSSPVPLTQTPG